MKERTDEVRLCYANSKTLTFTVYAEINIRTILEFRRVYENCKLGFTSKSTDSLLKNYEERQGCRK
jgi:hypothetical protein